MGSVILSAWIKAGWAAALLLLAGGMLLPAQDEVVVGLSLNERMPDVQLKTSTGNPFKLRPATLGKWTVVFYFRGGWCPYGRRQIKEFRGIDGKLLDENVDVIGISPDSPGRLMDMVQEFQVGFILISDEKFDAALSMGLMETLPLKGTETYERAGAILMPLSQGGYAMPRSALWLVNPDGKVAFAHLPADAKKTLSGAEIIQIIAQEKAKANLKNP